MKRTTLKIEDSLLRELKQRAAAEGSSMQDLANRLLRRGLAARPQQPWTLCLTGWKAEPQPGADILDRRTLFDVMDGR